MIEFKDLSKPIPFTWEVKDISKGGCICSPFLPLDNLIRHLDAVCGPENWEGHIVGAGQGTAFKLGIRHQESMIWKYGLNFGEACHFWGIGLFINAIEDIKIKTFMNEDKIYCPWHHITKYKKPCPENILVKKDGKLTNYIKIDKLTEYINTIILD